MLSRQNPRHDARAYQLHFISFQAVATDGEVHLVFIDDEDNVLFACHLEVTGCELMAEACVKALASAGLPDTWVKAPNPNACRETLELLGREVG